VEKLEKNLGKNDKNNYNTYLVKKERIIVKNTNDKNNKTIINNTNINNKKPEIKANPIELKKEKSNKNIKNKQPEKTKTPVQNTENKNNKNQITNNNKVVAQFDIKNSKTAEKFSNSSNITQDISPKKTFDFIKKKIQIINIQLTLMIIQEKGPSMKY